MADTRYAKHGNVHLAYQVRGAGAQDIVLLPDWMTHIDVLGEMPEFGRFLDRLAGLGRLITTDIRGVGASDPVEHGETRREDWIGDIAAVMAAAGSTRASLVGLGHGGQLAMLFAAAHPEATASLILVNTFARLARADDYRPGMPLALQHVGRNSAAYSATRPTNGAIRSAVAPYRLRWARARGTLARLLSSSALILRSFESRRMGRPPRPHPSRRALTRA
jgi:pimeloyl-ACP methyl ester carboxylesterase